MKNIAKTVFWLAAVFALSYMGIIYYSVGLMIMAFFCLILGIVEQLVLQMQMKQLAVKITTDVFATVCGENVTVQLLLHNPTKYPLLGLEVKVQMQEGQEKVTQVWKGSILAKEEERANVVLTPTHCQVTEIAVTQITGYSFLGLQKKKLAPKGQLQSVYVYPKAFDTDIRKLPKMVGDQIEEAEEPEDVEESGKHSVASTEIKGMREYQPGDRLRQINWKMTAKYDALYVKEYSSCVSCSYAIHIDGNRLCQAAKDVRDEMYGKLLSISISLLKNKENHYLCYELYQTTTQGRLDRTKSFYPKPVQPGFCRREKWITNEADIYEAIRELYQSVQGYDAANVDGRINDNSVNEDASTKDWIAI